MMETTDVMRWIAIYGLGHDKWEPCEPFSLGAVTPQEADSCASLDSLDMTGEKQWFKGNWTTLQQDLNTMCAEIEMQQTLPADALIQPLPLPPRLRPLCQGSGSQPIPLVDSVGSPPPMHFMQTSKDRHSGETAIQYLHSSFDKGGEYRLHHNGGIVQTANPGGLTCVEYIPPESYYARATFTPAGNKRKKSKKTKARFSRAIIATPAVPARHAVQQSKTASPAHCGCSRRVKTRDDACACDSPTRRKKIERNLPQYSWLHQSSLSHSSSDNSLFSQNGIASLIESIVKPSRGHLPPPPPLIHTSSLPAQSSPPTPSPGHWQSKLAMPPSLWATFPSTLDKSVESPDVVSTGSEPNETMDTVRQTSTDPSCMYVDRQVSIIVPVQPDGPSPPEDQVVMFNATKATSHVGATPGQSPGGVAPKPSETRFEGNDLTTGLCNDQVVTSPCDDQSSAPLDETGLERPAVAASDNPSNTVGYDLDGSAYCTDACDDMPTHIAHDMGIADCTNGTSATTDSDRERATLSDEAATDTDCTTDGGGGEDDEGFASDANVCCDWADKGTRRLWEDVPEHAMCGIVACCCGDAVGEQPLSSVLEHTRRIVDVDYEVIYFTM